MVKVPIRLSFFIFLPAEKAVLGIGITIVRISYRTHSYEMFSRMPALVRIVNMSTNHSLFFNSDYYFVQLRQGQTFSHSLSIMTRAPMNNQNWRSSRNRYTETERKGRNPILPGRGQLSHNATNRSPPGTIPVFW